MKTLGMRLRELRRESTHTQKEVAKFLGMNISTLSGYETDFRVPPLESIVALARFYGVSEGFIMSGDNIIEEDNEGLTLLNRANEILNDSEKKELYKFMKIFIESHFEERQ